MQHVDRSAGPSTTDTKRQQVVPYTTDTKRQQGVRFQPLQVAFQFNFAIKCLNCLLCPSPTDTFKKLCFCLCYKTH